MANFLVDHDRMATGCHVQPADTRAGMVKYTGPRIKESDYESTDALRPYVPLGLCQASVPACCEFATIKAYMTKFHVTTGKPSVPLSICASYQENVNGDFTSGDAPMHSLRSLATKGAYPVVDGLPVWFDRPRSVPADAVARRHLFRADEFEDCQEAADLISAILNMDPTNIGIDWYDTDVNPGPTGHLLVRGNRVVGGHSLTGCGIVMNYRPSPSGLGILFNNHHGDKLTPTQHDERGNTFTFPVWGDDGFGVMPIERAVAGMPKYGAFALRSVFVPDAILSDVPTPNFSSAA